MSWWGRNCPELYDEIIFNEMVNRGLAKEDDDPFEVVQEFAKRSDSHHLIADAEREFRAGRIDDAKQRFKDTPEWREAEESNRKLMERIRNGVKEGARSGRVASGGEKEES